MVCLQYISDLEYSVLWAMHCSVTAINKNMVHVAFAGCKQIPFPGLNGQICMSRVIKQEYVDKLN